MAITTKKYYCPVCENEENHSTNHYGEIYTRCRACGNSPMYCAENMEVRIPDAKAKIVFYRFNLNDYDENHKQNRIEYKTLCEKLSKKYGGSTTFSCRFDVFMEHKGIKALEQHDQKIVDVYNRSQFESQYVTSLGRLHNWLEVIFPNKRIKVGYYLEFVE